MTTSGNSRRVTLMIFLLGIIAVLTSIWPIDRAFLNIEIDSNEGWNAYYAEAAMGRMPLYPSRDKLITNNYPPLSFYIVGAVGRLIGDPILAGRLLSLIAVIAISGGAAGSVLLLGGSRAAALIGGLYFSATMCRFFTDYVGMDDPHLLGQALMTLGFVWFLKALHRDRGYAIPFLVMLAAGFVKHNIIVMPLTALVWLFLQRPSQAAKIGLMCVCGIGVGFAVCYEAFGSDCFSNILSQRSFRWNLAAGAVGHLQGIVVGLIGWAYLALKRNDPGVNLCSLLIAFGIVNFFIQKSGEGVAYNAQFELVFAVSIAVGLVFTHAATLPLAQRFPAEALRFAFLLAICVRLIAAQSLQPMRLFFDSDFHREIRAREAAMDATVARIRAIPGDVDCNTFACYRAGKPFAVDPFNCPQRIKAGNLPPDAISKLIASHQLTAVPEDPLLSWSHKLDSPVLLPSTPQPPSPPEKGL